MRTPTIHPGSFSSRERPDPVRLVHVDPAGGVLGDADHRRGDCPCRDRPVPAERADEHEPECPSREDREPLSGTALPAVAEEQRGPEDVHAIERQLPNRFLHLALHPVVEDPRLAIRAQRAHQEKLAGAVPGGEPRELVDVGEVHPAERLL